MGQPTQGEAARGGGAGDKGGMDRNGDVKRKGGQVQTRREGGEEKTERDGEAA